MNRDVLLENSALRIFEKSAHNGVQKGEIGLVCSLHGVGKTAYLVHLSVDTLLQKKHVIHVSLGDSVEHIATWYKNTCVSLSENTSMANEMHDELTKNRVIVNLSQRTDPVHIFTTMHALMSKGNFDVDVIVIDNYDLQLQSSDMFLSSLRSFAIEANVAVWLSSSFNREDLRDEKNIPDFVTSRIPLFEVALLLESQGDSVHLNLLKEHDEYPDDPLKLSLDGKSLLIKKE